MSQAVEKITVRRKRLAVVIRLAGIGLLVMLLASLDLDEIREGLRTADVGLMFFSALVILPLILFKTLRWQGILRAQSIRLALWPALLAYFGSLFIGFLTPGRLGEFIKAVHVSRDCNVSLAQAFSGVLADRLFDLYTLLGVGSAALLTLALGKAEIVGLTALILALTVPLGLLLHDPTFAWFQRIGLRLGPPGRALFSDGGLLVEVRSGLRCLTGPWLVVAVLLTLVSYGVFFGQCYLIALALNLPVGFGPVMFAVALGSLVTLIPVSVSGLGTREAAMIAYLGTAGVKAEAAVSFSLMVFVIFYIAGGVIGALAWWIKPVPLDYTIREHRTS